MGGSTQLLVVRVDSLKQVFGTVDPNTSSPKPAVLAGHRSSEEILTIDDAWLTSEASWIATRTHQTVHGVGVLECWGLETAQKFRETEATPQALTARM